VAAVPAIDLLRQEQLLLVVATKPPRRQRGDLRGSVAKATETALDYQLTSNLYRKYVGMMRIALGAEP
jgi:hypothetical protein